MPKRVANAKIACLDFSLQKSKMHLGVSVVVENPDKLEEIRKRSVIYFSVSSNAILENLHTCSSYFDTMLIRYSQLEHNNYFNMSCL